MSIEMPIMPPGTLAATVLPPTPRQHAVLDAAVAVFARYGYRKTSMDEIARAAGVSRQGLYLQFANKDELFRKAVAHTLSAQLDAAIIALSNENNSFEDKLLKACEEWAGQHAGTAGTDAADLMCASTSLAGATLAYYEAGFEAAVAHAVAQSEMAAHCAAGGFSAAEFARALHATARGLKQRSRSRAEFSQGMSVAARLFCAPLRRRS